MSRVKQLITAHATLEPCSRLSIYSHINNMIIMIMYLTACGALPRLQIVGAQVISLIWDAATRTWAVSDASHQQMLADSTVAAPPCGLIPFTLVVTLPPSSTGSNPPLLSTMDEMQHLLDMCSSSSHMATNQPSTDSQKAGQPQPKPAKGCLPANNSSSSHAQPALQSGAAGGGPALSLDLVASLFAPDDMALTGNPEAQQPCQPSCLLEA